LFHSSVFIYLFPIHNGDEEDGSEKEEEENDEAIPAKDPFDPNKDWNPSGYTY
jgi:hypothetical protein